MMAAAKSAAAKRAAAAADAAFVAVVVVADAVPASPRHVALTALRAVNATWRSSLYIFRKIKSQLKSIN